MPMWICWALLFIACSSCSGEFGVVSQLATKPVFFPTQSQMCLQALFLIFHPSLSQIFCTLIFPQAIFGSLSSNHASCSTESRRGGSCIGSSCIQGALAILSSMCWRFSVPQRDQNSFPSTLFQSLQLLSCTVCPSGERQIMENPLVCLVQAFSHLGEGCWRVMETQSLFSGLHYP